ncbi:acetyl/propionyl-CoA carboxylase subunit alpha [Williamsia sp. 1138]|uniref:acetyl/propionyl/methylcrotonyl-CoA carboxylase subunit alpha n=1 Tax=Williamsia sp. 1138 TaxID=1903117 RepID=UPI000A100C35|nr:biotin carboxylase N-terminal domain-containing protein [Williamsia sp. 1138]OZG27710.1 acetyl/propionyl-CoA carboxylase subunit alpha [Williamsia sp. 1138]
MTVNTTPIRTLLIANRGEIARRVIRTARALGIRTVAVYSTPDVRSPHVTDADFAVPIGGASSAESYLMWDKILDAATRTGADAIHPGYGFLSENAEFAEACEAAGIVFVGPSPDSIREMGLKDRAKEWARKAEVPVLLDAVITGEDTDAWTAAAAEVGFPLLVKAVAGGGGKGMRLVERSDDVVEAIAAARREGLNLFGNATVFLERYLTASRHIEIQVFGDKHGNAVHLGERECSIQRRHQKVLEEAPSPVITADVRQRMGATAVSLVRELGYIGAGTVEYLFDDTTGGFYFLEMNTRLQVEHPVTEEVTGLDLVALQLRVARGEQLGFEQSDVQINGHAIEVRLYAEDPAADYAPTPGTLHRYEHPDRAGLRYEDGIAAPSQISSFYDPMIAKIIAHGATRSEAAFTLAAALDGTQVHGVTTNRAFLAALLRDPDYLAGATRTDFLEHHPQLLDPPMSTPWPVHLAAAVATGAARRKASDPTHGLARPGFRPLATRLLTHATWHRAGDSTPLEVDYHLGGWSGQADLTIVVDDESHGFTLSDLTPESVRINYDGVDYPCTVWTYPDGSVWVNDAGSQSGWHPAPRLPDPDDLAATALGPVNEIPGTVVHIGVEVGDSVTAGQKLVVVEAMKMEHPATAATDGVVEKINVSVGQYVDAHTVLVTLAAPQEEQS